ncbi:MAG: complex I NDUFA9 subunit family protein [Alphaproteobacteria bacterium]|nr:complex I NDUFA9 subunit family protein [Alphaproteobacteria bacterium]
MALRRVTVFGGSGFLGSYVVERLADRDAIVQVAVRDPEAAKHLRPLGQVGQVTPVACDIKDPGAVERAVAGADTVINLVGILAEQGRQNFRAVHVDAPAAIARAAATQGVESLVHVSAVGSSRQALSEYSRSKSAGEEAVREAYPDAVIMRPSVIFGPEDGFFNLFAGLARFAPALPLFGGGTTRFQPVYVADVADAVLRGASDASVKGQTFELGGPRVYTFAELMELMLSEVRRKRMLVPVPFIVGDIQATFADLIPSLGGLVPKPPVTRDQMKSLRADNVVAPDAKTLSDLDIQATAVETIIPTYLHRYRRGGRIGRASYVD